MNKVFVHGIGCVSPAGWGVNAMREALACGAALPTTLVQRPKSVRPLPYRAVPPAPAKLPFMAHPRFRRTSPLTVYAAAAAVEAMEGAAKGARLGIIFCAAGGCVQYTRRFYDETWRDPTKASPLIFPETVFNAPSSHLSALLESPHINYTWIGDPSTVLQAMATGAGWVAEGRVDQCLVIGAEENDWLFSDAYRLFSRQTICAEGAGAVLLSAGPSPVELECVSDARLYLNLGEKTEALRSVREELAPDDSDALLCDSRIGMPERDKAELEVWGDWPGRRLSPKAVLGEGLSAGAAWQCVASIDALRRGDFGAVVISVAGTHEHAIGARFVRATLEK